MGWDFSGTAPIYQQIAAHLRLRIFDGTYESGQRMPSVRDIAEEANTNPNTVMRAFTQLEKEGLICARSTLGFYITEDRGAIEDAKDSLALCITAEYRKRMAHLGFGDSKITEYIKACEKGAN